MQQSQGGALAFLDGIMATVVKTSEVVGTVKGNLKGPQPDQTPVKGASTIQTAPGTSMLWVLVGGVGLVLLVMLVKRA